MSAEVIVIPDTALRARGSVAEVARLAAPIVVQTMSETAMQLIDTAMVGQLGTTAIGAIGFGGLWVWTLFVPFTGMAQGVQTFVAQDDGAGRPERCGAWIWQALGLLVPAMTLWMFAVALFFPWLVHAIGPSPELQVAAIGLGRARLFGGPAVVVTFALSSFFRGIGDTRTPLAATLVGVATNVLLAYGLIFGQLGLPRLGVVGAGLAQSGGSWAIASVLLAAALRRRVRERYHTRPVRPRLAALARFARTSAPVGGQWFLDMLTFSLFGSIVARMGDTSMAASQSMLQLLALSFMQAFAISLSCGTLVGRYIGAGDLESAERSFRSGQCLGLLLAGLIAALFCSAPELLLRIFSGDPQFLELGRPLLALAALFQVVDAVAIIASGALRGAGDTRWPFLVQTALAWLLRLPAVYVAAVTLEGGVLGAWIGELGYVFVLCLALLGRFRSGHWRNVRI